MGIRLLLDTSFCLYLIREKPPALLTALTPFQPGELAVSSITAAALEARAQNSRHPKQNQRALQQFLLPLTVADFDAKTAQVLGQIAAPWERASAGADTHSLLLAAHALRLDATILSRHPEMYPALPGLRCNRGEAEALLAALPSQPFTESSTEQAAPRFLPTALETAENPAHTIVAVGSHDLSLDLLADALHRVHPGVNLVSAHVGSMNGLLALRRGQAHLAGVHLFDPESGEFNTAHIRRLLVPHGCRVVLVEFVKRTQGLFVARDNPKGIQGLADLLRPDVVMVNRQPGAGTRLLLDAELERLGLDASQIRGYERWETSHLQVAGAVERGEADCGLGIQAAADSFHLGFLPLFQERYDLVFARDAYENPQLRPLLEMLRQPPQALLEGIQNLGGYEIGQMGRVLAEL